MTDQDKNEIRQIIREELDKTFVIDGIKFGFVANAQPGPVSYAATDGFATVQGNAGCAYAGPPPSQVKLAAAGSVGQCCTCPTCGGNVTVMTVIQK